MPIAVDELQPYHLGVEYLKTSADACELCKLVYCQIGDNLASWRESREG
jgi:hypothetical protein